MSHPRLYWSELKSGTWVACCDLHGLDITECYECLPGNSDASTVAYVDAFREAGPPAQCGDEQECSSCHGTGWYVGLHRREHCDDCFGSGWT